MRIFYNVKKRRIIIRLTIAIISIFLVTIVIKGYFMPPSATPALATANPKQTSSAVPVQSNLPANTPTSSHIPEITPTASVSVDGKNQEPTPSTFSPSAALSSPDTTPSPSQTSIPSPQSTKNTESTAVSKINTPTVAPSPIATKAAAKTSAKVSTPTPTENVRPTATPKNPTPMPKISNTIKSGELQIMYFNSNTASSSNTINPMFKLINNTNEDINLAEIKIRYYFTVDSNVKQNFWCDWCTAGTSNVFGRFVELKTAKSSADQYLEIGFTDASGFIAAGKTIEIQTRFSKADWTDFSQSNDYSFNPSKGYVRSDKITLHINGKLVYGKEP